MNNLKNKALGSFLGSAICDALGTTLEFQKRDHHPLVTDLVGGGVFNLRPGEWTDDTAMALCLADSLIEFKGFNPEDQMKKYCDWYLKGYNSSNGYCFDIGGTVRQALEKFMETGQAYAGGEEIYQSGNGSLMRLTPIPIFYRTTLENEEGLNILVKKAADSSRTTHGTKVCLASCKLYALMINKAFNDLSKENILNFSNAEINKYDLKVRDFEVILNQDYKNKTRDDIKSTGYVVDSLEAALWAFYNSNNFKDGAILAVNLAGDADTIGAIYGQLAGAFYGVDGIPEEWLNKVVMKNTISETTLNLLK